MWPHWTLVPMVSQFLDSFKPTAQMVTSMLKHRMRPIVEQTGKPHHISSWKLDPQSLKFILKGNITYARILPYETTLVEPQRDLLAFIIRQLYCKDLIGNVMGVQKPQKDPATGQSIPTRYPMLEEQLVRLFVDAMEESEKNPDDPNVALLWWNVSSLLIFFLLYSYVNFTTFVKGIHDDFHNRGHVSMRHGRDFLMWSLLQFISGSVAKHTSTDFMPVLQLFNFYETEKEPLPVPNLESDKAASRKLAAAALYIHLARRGNVGKDGEKPGLFVKTNRLQFALPTALTKHYEFLRNISGIDDSTNKVSVDVATSLYKDFKVPVICSTFSTAQDYFQHIVADLVKTISGVPASGPESTWANAETTPMPGKNCSALAPTLPMPMDVLDAMSVHAKMSVTHSIVAIISKHITSKTAHAFMSPASVETYCRLLVYSEIESLCVKGLMTQLLPHVFKPHAWGILHIVLEIFSYRIHHVQSHFRLSLLNHLQSTVNSNPNSQLTKHFQLYSAVETASLRLITSLSNAEITAQRATPGGNPRGDSGVQKHTQVMYGDSEELNKVVVLSLARGIHINGLEQSSPGWVKEMLTQIMAKTPHNWPPHTLDTFPQILKDFYNVNNHWSVSRLFLIIDFFRTTRNPKKAAAPTRRCWRKTSRTSTRSGPP